MNEKTIHMGEIPSTSVSPTRNNSRLRKNKPRITCDYLLFHNSRIKSPTKLYCMIRLDMLKFPYKNNGRPTGMGDLSATI